MKQHDFSPIINAGRLEQAIEFVATNAIELGKAALGRELELDTICFFAHSAEELVFLRQSVLARGPRSHFTHGATLYADTDFMVRDWHIKIFGVRDVTIPDPTRTQVGYGDYPVDNYEQLLAAVPDNPYTTEITSGQGVSLVELRHPDFDVLGFVADARNHAS